MEVQKRQPKNLSTHFFAPDYTRIQRQVMVNTEGPLPNFLTNDQILRVMRNGNNNRRFETTSTTSAEQGAALHIEINSALARLEIHTTNI